MRLDPAGDCHLTYCTNVHPGETWPEVRDILSRHLPLVKAKICPDASFGVGLRLSGVAAQALSDPAALSELQDILRERGLYVFTINGFPYGRFHGTPVKTEVYRPDWLEDERLRYTNLLADILVELLPDDASFSGSISTVPGAFKSRVPDAAAERLIASGITRHAAYLHDLREKTGRTITLALEPEPCCFIETIAETVAFFQDRLFSADNLRQMADDTGLATAAAEEALRRHVGVCLDTCHAAVEFETASECIEDLRRAGIALAKVQLSAGLRIAAMTPAAAGALGRFNDEVYLHQVVERRDGALNRYLDLPEAFEALGDGDGNGDGDREWRVHFHVPIFLAELGAFSSTQDFLRDMLMLHREAPLSAHLEVETYTWDVLPDEYRGTDVEAAIARELEWVRSVLAG